MSEQIKISQLPVLSTMTDSATVPVVAAATTQQISGANLKTYFASNIANLSAGNLLVTNIAEIADFSIAGGTVTLLPGAVDTMINISPDIEGQAFLQIPNDDTANTANVRLVNNAGNVRIESSAGNIWTFGYDSNLVFPSSANTDGLNFNGGTASATVSLNVFSPDGNTVSIQAQGNSSNAVITTYANATTTTNTWTFGINGNVTIPGNIVSTSSIDIDNRVSGNSADIRLYAADDIVLQAGNRTLADDTEGGDINIFAGNGSPEGGGNSSGTGGDIQIIGGRGGAADTTFGATGGVITITGGRGGAGSASGAAGSGSNVSITAGSGGADNGGGGSNGGSIRLTAGDSTDAAEDRGSIVLSSGEGGDETTNGGYVQISIPSVGTNPGGDWTFTGSGTVLNTPADAEIFGANFGNITVGTWGNTIVRTLGDGLVTYDWVFSNAGNLAAPGDISTTGSVNVAGNINLTGAEASDTARIFADVSGSNTSLVLEVGDDNADSIVLRHYSFAASNTINMLTATRASDTTANVSVTGNISATGNITTDSYIAAGNIGVSTTITTQTLVTDPGPLSGLTLAFGARGFINDGNLAAAGNFGAQVAGGGGNSVPVWSDGTNWYIG